MPYKDPTALKAWREKNRIKIRDQTNARQKKFWTKRQRPKLPPFDRKENRNRIKQLKILGIHLIGLDKKLPTLFQDANACMDCGEIKRIIFLDSVTVKIPRILLRLPYVPLDEKADNIEERISNFKGPHCEHFRFDDSAIMKKLTHDFQPQCFCDFSHKRRITFESYIMAVAFCYECLMLHFADYDFDLCQRCIPKLLKAFQTRTRGIMRPRFRSVFPDETPEQMRDTGLCRLCCAEISQVSRDVKTEQQAPFREAYRFLDARSALEKTAFLDDLTLTPEQIVRALEGVDLRPIPKLAQLDNELYTENQ